MHPEATEEDTLTDDLIRGTVRVTAVMGDKAWVEAESQSACGGCAATGSCGTHSILQFFGAKNVPLEVENNFEGVVGDRLEVGLMSSTVLKVAALIYLLPLAGLVVGIFAGAALDSGDGVTMAFAVVGLIAAFQLTRSLYGGKRFAGAVAPVVLRKLEPEDARQNTVERLIGSE